MPRLTPQEAQLNAQNELLEWVRANGPTTYKAAFEAVSPAAIGQYRTLKHQGKIKSRVSMTQDGISHQIEVGE